MWQALAGAALQAGASIYGANAAANAQQRAAKQAGNTAVRTGQAGVLANEPTRQLGYNAIGDLSALYGYNQAPYTPANALMTQLQPLKAKQAAGMAKRGASYEQIAGMGTLGQLNNKQTNKLGKYFTPEQIAGLRTGQTQTAAPAQTQQQQPGNMSRFFASPDYQFRQSEGVKALDQSAAARGGALSGNALRAVTDYSSNLAAGEYGNYVNRLMGMAQLGQQGVSGATGAITGAGGALMGAQQAQGDARASGVLGTTNAIGQGAQNYLMWDWLNKQGQSGGSGGFSQYGPWGGGYRMPGG